MQKLKQKQVLMVLDHEFPPDDRVYKEAKTLISQGFGVTIACYTHKKKILEEDFEGISIIRKKIPKIIYKSSVAALRFPFYFSWWKNYLKDLLKLYHFDILHIHDLPLASVGNYFKKKNGLKLVIDLHENYPSFLAKATHLNGFWGNFLSPNKKWINYEKTILSKADIIVTVVQEMKERIAQFGYNEDKIIVVENTIKKGDFPKLADKTIHQDFVLSFAGGLNIERGLQHVIPALKTLAEEIPNIKLKIVGSGSYLPNLESLVKKYKVEEQVEFLGWKNLEEVMDFTAQSDITLIPHLKWEQTDCSSPNKLYQCMYAGVPLVVSNCNSIKRIVEETKSGVSYTFDSQKEFTEAVLYLYRNDEIRKKMGESGKNAILNKYHWDNTSGTLVEKYKQLT